MRRITLPAVRFILVVAIAFALSSLIDPYLGLGSPLFAQAVNAALPVTLVLLVWALAGRAWLALVVEILVLGVLHYASVMKLLYLNTDVVYADFTVLGGLLTDPHLVLGFLHPTAKKIVVFVVVVVAAVLIGWFTRRQRTAGWKFRLGCAVLGVGAVVAIGAVPIPDAVAPLHWQVYAQAHGAQQVGVAGNILLGRMTTRDVNRVPDPAAERAFWNEPAVRAAGQRVDPQGDGRRPDIVIVQSESLFEPSQLCGFSDTPVLKHVAQQQPELPGNLEVPVFGGRTLQTEFEVLSGAPIAYYPGSMFAYYELVNHRFDALPRVLDGDGYKTIAIHPNDRGFWRRNIAFPDMGFDSFQDINSFIYPEDFSNRNFVSDEALTRAILAELDSSNRPTFVMAISMNNHGPWGAFAPASDSSLGLPSRLHGKARAAMADYVEHAIDADNAYGFLLDALKRRGRPTVVVIYGDHMPALPRVYQQLCFKNGKSAEEHYPPYRIWANFPMPKPPDVTSAYLLQGWLMHVAGLPLKGPVLANFLAGAAAQDPSVTAAQRGRLLDEYANIAAANVAATVPPVRGVHTVFVGSNEALPILLKRQSGERSGVTVSDSGLQFAPAAGTPARIDLGVGAAVASLTLRPYLGGSSLRCVAAPETAHAQITVTGDSRELYRATLTSKTFRLATLDLQGVKHLSIQVTGAASPGRDAACGQVTVQVAQMQCFSARCRTPGPALPVGSPAAAPARILADDPSAGDVADLASMAPLARRRVAGKMGNLDWLLQHEIGKQDGDVPVMVQQDARLFMPPADHDAWIEFDVSGLDGIELSPRINKLSAECLALDKPDARVGVVGLTLSLDGKPLRPRLIVDRDYDKTLDLDVKGGHTFRIDVDKGNSVTWCDWFSVGFPKITGSAMAPASVAPGAGEAKRD